MADKKLRFLSALIICLVWIGSFALPIFADDEVSSAIGEAVSFKFGGSDEKSINDYAQGELCDGAGETSEWSAMTIARLYDTDLSKYAEALEKYISENEEPSATSREKFALALTAAGSRTDTASKLLKDSVGGQGIMSYVFALHIMNNGVTAEGVSDEETIRNILDMRLPDGGWAVIGEYGDIDVTAMVLEALAPRYEDSEEIKSVCDEAIDFLSGKQLESGGFKSMGAENCESSAQVVCALSAFGIDCVKDERFIKNGNSPLGALLSYRLSDGSFSHIPDGDSNESATTQALYALVSYKMMQDGRGSFFVFDRTQTVMPESSVSESESSTSSSAVSKAQKEETKTGYKPIAIGAVIAAGVIAAAVLIILKKRSYKNFVFIALICGGICAVIVFTDIKTKDEYFSDSRKSEAKAVGTVTMSIRCDTIAGEGGNVPDDGVILDTAEYELHEGDTAYDILRDATKKNEILLDTKGAKNIYVSGIAGIYEFDFGELSGWVYHVNGISASVGASSYELSDGDNIEWLYTRNIEKDLF